MIQKNRWKQCKKGVERAIRQNNIRKERKRESESESQ